MLPLTLVDVRWLRGDQDDDCRTAYSGVERKPGRSDGPQRPYQTRTRVRTGRLAASPPSVYWPASWPSEL